MRHSFSINYFVASLPVSLGLPVILGPSLNHQDTARAKEMLRKAGKDGGKEGAQVKKRRRRELEK
jgi:hypothetical protein